MFNLVTENAEALTLAAIGGFFLNMMNLYEDHKRPRSRRVRKDAMYWVFFAFWPFAGAVIAYVYIATGAGLRGFSAFLAGLTAPGFLQNLMHKTLAPESVNLANVENE